MLTSFRRKQKRMAKSKRKLQEEKRNKAQEKKFFTIAFIVTAVIVIFMFIRFLS